MTPNTVANVTPICSQGRKYKKKPERNRGANVGGDEDVTMRSIMTTLVM